MSKPKNTNGFFHHFREHLIIHFLEPFDSDISFALGVSIALFPLIMGIVILLAYGSTLWIVGVLITVVGTVAVYSLVGFISAVISGVSDTRSSRYGMATRISRHSHERWARQGYIS